MNRGSSREGNGKSRGNPSMASVCYYITLRKDSVVVLLILEQALSRGVDELDRSSQIIRRGRIQKKRLDIARCRKPLTSRIHLQSQDTMARSGRNGDLSPKTYRNFTSWSHVVRCNPCVLSECQVATPDILGKVRRLSEFCVLILANCGCSVYETI